MKTRDTHLYSKKDLKQKYCRTRKYEHFFGLDTEISWPKNDKKNARAQVKEGLEIPIEFTMRIRDFPLYARAFFDRFLVRALQKTFQLTVFTNFGSKIWARDQKTIQKQFKNRKIEKSFFFSPLEISFTCSTQKLRHLRPTQKKY